MKDTTTGGEDSKKNAEEKPAVLARTLSSKFGKMKDTAVGEGTFKKASDDEGQVSTVLSIVDFFIHAKKKETGFFGSHVEYEVWQDERHLGGSRAQEEAPHRVPYSCSQCFQITRQQYHRFFELEARNVHVG